MSDNEFRQQMGDAQTKTSFGIKEALDDKKARKQVSMSGDVLFKDIQLFIPELVINIGLLVFGVIGIFFVRLLSAIFLEDYAKYVSPQALEIVTGQMSFMIGVITIGIAVPVLISLVLFGFKWYFFYPRGKKQIVVRAWKMGVARIGVEEIRDNEVAFEPGKDLSDKMHINYSFKGIDYYTSRPIILLEEGQSENTPLHKSVQTNEKVKDKGNVNASIFSAALKFADYQNKKAQNFWSNPSNLILLAVLGVSVVTAFLVFRQPEILLEAIKKYLSGGVV
jgi:hypothetical protein